VDLIYDFCNWLVRKRLTKIKLGFYGDKVPTLTSEKEKMKNEDRLHQS